MWKSVRENWSTMHPQETIPISHRKEYSQLLHLFEFSFFTTDFQVLTIRSYY